MRSEFKPRTITRRNKRGELVSEPHEVTKVWKDYFQDLLEGRDEPIVLQNVHTEQDIIADEENPPPSITEVDEPEVVNALHKIMVKICGRLRKFPVNGKKALSVPFLKKETNLNVLTIGELLSLTRHIKYSPTCCFQDFSLILTKLYKEPQVTQVIRSNRLRCSATSGEALKTARPELTHLRILWDLEQEEDHQQGG
ncbi:reverse transcriptase domain-containing protein [Trichonephila clavipes]|nr:reverse transcriptase domain-containing protein [Trichonephila clavipes]